MGNPPSEPTWVLLRGLMREARHWGEFPALFGAAFPGAAIVTVVAGALTYRDAHANACRDVTYNAGTGFVDSGHGHVHKAIAGPAGADFYVVYLLPPGSASHVITTGITPPEECPA